MEIASKCKYLITLLNSGNNTIKYIKRKTDEIVSFSKLLSQQEIKENLLKTSHIVDVVIAILNMSIVDSKNPEIKPESLKAVIIFFSCLAQNNIPLAKEEKDIEELIKFMSDTVISNDIIKSDDGWWTFWLNIFTEFMKIPTFFNLFQGKCDDNDDSILFTLINSLMKYKKISTNESYSVQRSMALELFFSFLKVSPYSPSQDSIFSFFEISNLLADFEMKNIDFINFFSILNEIIALSPISFCINSFDLSQDQFHKKILQKIYKDWPKYQISPYSRKAASTYLLQFLTMADALKYEIEQNFYDDWAKQILDSWLKFKNRDKILDSFKDIPFLRADIELLTKSKDKSISKCLLQYILPNKIINHNLNIIWLFTAIGLYAPNIVQQEDWLQILGSINSFNIGDAFLSNQESISDFYNLISLMIDIIGPNSQWNNVFSFLIENKPSKEELSPFYILITKFFSKQKIDTKIAHQNQHLLWEEKSVIEQYPIEKLICIHNLIYYYGFSNNNSRNDCFNSLLSLLDSEEFLSIEYLKQLSITICSIISTYPFPLIFIKQEKKKETTIEYLNNELKNQIEIINNNISSQKVQIAINKETKCPLCNFISNEMQLTLVKNIKTKFVKNKTNECYFQLFITTKMPDFFKPIIFYQNFLRSFQENCNGETFPEFFKILLTIANEISEEQFIEEFITIFESIKESFFDIADQYLELCDGKIHDFFQDEMVISWPFIQNSENEDFYINLQLFSELSVKLSSFIDGLKDNFYDCFCKFFPTSVLIPTLHLKICSNLLNLDLSDEQKGEIIKTIENVTNQVLHVLLVPVKDKDLFVEELLNTIKYEYTQELEDLFKCISKYKITPSMKLNLLNVMKNNFKNCSQVFDCFWQSENYSLFFVDDEISMIRLRSIETITSILKLDEISFFDGSEMKSIIFDKHKYFEEFISPFLEDILNGFEDDKCNQLIFTALKTLIQIAAEVPVLAKESLNMAINFFKTNLKIFTKKCINVLFSGLSEKVHFSLVLRQLIPILVSQQNQISDDYPFELFYYDRPNISKDEAERLFRIESEPFLSDFQKVCEQLAEKFMTPIPLLSFVLNENEESIKASYQEILQKNSPKFDLRTVLFLLYSKICKAHHELVQSFYFQQFSLFILIIFEKHKEQLEAKKTLYSDILGYSVNLLEIIPHDESLLSLLTSISLNVPDHFNMKMVGFVKNIESICFYLGQHECLNNFFEKFPELINEILIFDFLKENQLEKRTPFMEFKRIAETQRINQESITLLLTNFIENPSSFEFINTLSNDMKRIVLNVIYHFAVLHPKSLALHLYSELFLNFIHIHPSPLIAYIDINSSILLFTKLLELTRDKNPSICRYSLTVLHNILNSKFPLPKPVIENTILIQQLLEYKIFEHPKLKVKKPDENSPWICKYVFEYIHKMNEDQFCHLFEKIVAVSSDFCENLFPHFINECMNCSLVDSISSDFKYFAEDPILYLDQCCLFVKSFNYIRTNSFNGHHAVDKKWHLNWLKNKIDFQKIMEVCLKIGDPYSAYQFAEFAHEDVNMSDEPLNRIFTQLGVNDLKYGLDYNLSNPFSVADLFNQEGQLENALAIYDSGNNLQRMSDTLCELHLYNLLCNMKTSLSEKTIESFWRLRKWNISSEIVHDMNFDSHSASLFNVMQSFATKNKEEINQKLSDFSQRFHFDRNSSIFTQLSRLLDASALHWFHSLICQNDSKLFDLFNETLIDKYCCSLQKLENLSHQFYKVAESANALHAVFFCLIDSSTTLYKLCPKFFSEFVSNSLQNNEIGSAQYFITLLHESHKKNPQFANFEQIRALYKSNPHRAVSLLEKNYDQILLKEDTDLNGFNLRVEFARASWCANTNSLQTTQIYERLKKVIEKCDHLEIVDLLADAEFELARVFHRQLHEVCDFLMSSEFTTILKLVDEYKKAISLNQNRSKNNQDMIMKKNLDNYLIIIKNYKELYSSMIVGSIVNYMNALIHSNKYDLECSSSIIKIWFDYSYTKHDRLVLEIPNLIKEMNDRFIKIDPNKFLHLFYQITARVDDIDSQTSTQGDEYFKELQILLRKMSTLICRSNPRECFPVLFSFLQNVEQIKKKEAFESLIDSITTQKDLLEYWKQYESLLKNYLFLANISKTNEENYLSLSDIGSDLTNCTTDKMKHVSIITCSKEVGISRFFPIVRALNGLNRPLLITVVGTDGKIYKQIVKGKNDDLRQDAVMQQLFVLSSKLLSKKNPDLSIRNYKVVPLSPNSGLIEFVDGTIPIQDYLLIIDKDHQLRNCAHKRYYVSEKEIPIIDALNNYNTYWAEYSRIRVKTEKDRLDFIEFFKNLRKSLKSVLHFFFIEKFPNPADWLASRLRYCRHTATNSMVGYILGIGDRHLHNILIDEKTGEVIHIDLGIAFDQGKSLRFMEMVPFRLTNEIIDGMGWMGKEGVFRKTCEESMKVLRINAEYLLTVLQVFISDPLYKWKLVPKNRESPASILESIDDDNPEMKFAESVIITCQRKLDGRETGETLSVEGQVSKLINDAISDENLALMFPGWKPYL